MARRSRRPRDNTSCTRRSAVSTPMPMTRQEMNHWIEPFSWGLFQAPQASLFDRIDLFADRGEPRHLTANFIKHIGRDRGTLRGAHIREPLRCLTKLRLE